jgi:tetratricopeptide (TPR) repeat protein
MAQTTPAPSKPTGHDSPTVAAMKAAIALAEAGKTDEAVAAYEKMGVLKSKKMEAWRLNNEGLAYLTAATPAPDKAVPLLEKAVATDADNYVAWNNLGNAYENTDELEKAGDAYQKSIDAAKAANASSAKAEGNLQALQPRLDRLKKKNGDKSDAGDDNAPAAGDDQKK